MKTISFLNISRKIVALILVAYFSIFSPVTALAVVTQPVSAPISIPVPVPTSTPSPTATPSPTPSPSSKPTPTPQPTNWTAVNLTPPSSSLTPNGRGTLTVNVTSKVPSGSTATIVKGYISGSFTNLIPYTLYTVWFVHKDQSGYDPIRSDSMLSDSKGNIYFFGGANFDIYFRNDQPIVAVNLAKRSLDYSTGACSKENPCVSGLLTLPGQTPTPTITPNPTPIGIGNTAPVGIGSTNPTPTPTPAPLSCSFGDINYDNKIDTTDARLVARYAAGLEKFTDEQKRRADVNADGVINITDSQQILRYSLGFIKTFTACVQKPAPSITSITPSAGIVGSIAAVYGTRFGDKQWLVAFYNQKGQVIEKAPIIGWYDGGVKFRIPAVTKGTYSVEVQTADGRKSNKVNFTVTAAQPTISLITPFNLRVGNYMIISGSNFGNSGKINFYLPNSTAASASAINNYWSNSLIIAKIPPSLKANQQYGIQVRISDGTNLIDSSLVYRFISR